MNTNTKSFESGEDGLMKLIKQAGEDARLRKKEAMEIHATKLRATISAALSKNKKQTKV